MQKDPVWRSQRIHVPFSNGPCNHVIHMAVGQNLSDDVWDTYHLALK